MVVRLPTLQKSQTRQRGVGNRMILGIECPGTPECLHLEEKDDAAIDGSVDLGLQRSGQGPSFRATGNGTGQQYSRGNDQWPPAEANSYNQHGLVLSR